LFIRRVIGRETKNTSELQNQFVVSNTVGQRMQVLHNDLHQIM